MVRCELEYHSIGPKHPFRQVSIFLIVQFYGGAISHLNQVRCCIPRKAPKVALPVFLEERDVPQPEFLSLLGVVAAPFSSVLANPLAVVEGYHG